MVKEVLQTLEICLEKDMLLSKITQRLRTTEDGEIVMPENVIEEDKILRLCFMLHNDIIMNEHRFEIRLFDAVYSEQLWTNTLIERSIR